MYCVLAGCKKFDLLPPSSIAVLSERDFITGRYCSTPHPNYASTLSCAPEYPDWCIGFDEERALTPWILDDPVTDPRLHPIECYVKPGEVLYLPSLWYHRVTQTCPTIAVNFWYVDSPKFSTKHAINFTLVRAGMIWRSTVNMCIITWCAI